MIEHKIFPGDLVVFNHDESYSTDVSYHLYSYPTAFADSTGLIYNKTLCVVMCCLLAKERHDVDFSEHDAWSAKRQLVYSGSWVLLLTQDSLGWRWLDEVTCVSRFSLSNPR